MWSYVLKRPLFPSRLYTLCKHSISTVRFKSHTKATHQHRPPTKQSKKTSRRRKGTMKIAIEGCCHGELDAIYSQIALLEKQNKYKVDLLLICGDFQAIRNLRDLQCMAVPDKYRELGGFYKYYTGEKRAPVLTLVIGGNHEASNYLWELYHGGWLAPNIYFLGHAGCVQVNGIRIAGASGIYKPQDFRLGHWERVPYDRGSMRSVYHIREFNVRRLSLLSSPTIFLSHDWPRSIERHGNVQDLLRRKPQFRDDINKGVLGSPPLMGLLQTLKPDWWFSAHLHCRFEARVSHQIHAPVPGINNGITAENTNPDEIQIENDSLGETEPVGSAEKPEEQGPSSTEQGHVEVVPANPDEITLDDEVEDVAAQPLPPPPAKETKFVALDKCLPKRRYLEIVDVKCDWDVENSSRTERDWWPTISFDPEWLAITRAFQPYMSSNRLQCPYPDEEEARRAVHKEMDWVRDHVMANKAVKAVGDCQKFVMTAPAPGSEGKNAKQQPPHYPNPQTHAFCAMLEIDNKVDPLPASSTSS